MFWDNDWKLIYVRTFMIFTLNRFSLRFFAYRMGVVNV